MLVIKGLLAGLAIAVPVGPINVLIASRTLTKGRPSGLLSGLGAAAADGLYGAVAGFSITLVINLLMRWEFWIRMLGGILLVGMGCIYFRKQAPPLRMKEDPGGHSDFLSTFLLTLTNPTTVLSFLAVLTVMGLGGSRAGWLTLLLVGGIFCGSLLWWVVLVTLINWLRDRFNDDSIRWMNRIAGLAIGGFGLFTFILAMSHRP